MKEKVEFVLTFSQQNLNCDLDNSKTRAGNQMSKYKLEWRGLGVKNNCKSFGVLQAQRAPSLQTIITSESAQSENYQIE